MRLRYSAFYSIIFKVNHSAQEEFAMSAGFLLSAVSVRWPAYFILAIFIAAIAGCAFIGLKKSSSLNGYMLGDRGIGGWLSAFGYGTTYFSAVVFVGYAGTFGMSLGLGAVWIGIANAVVGSLIAWLVLANRTRVMTQNLNAKTMPEFFEKRYGSEHIKIVAAVIVFVLLVPYSTSVYQGIAYLSEAVFGLSFNWCVAIMAVLVGIYLFVGGFFANAVSNFVQGLIMIAGVIVMIALMLRTPQVNGAEGLKKLIEAGYGFFPSFESSGFWFDSPAMALITNILLTSFGIWAVPQSVSKFYAIKDKSAVTRGTVISTLFALLVGGGAYFNGAFSRLFFGDASESANIIPDMLLSANLGFWVLGLIGILVLSASMSTLSSLSLAGATTLSVDIYKGYIKPDADDKKVKLIMRVLCMVFVAVSAVLALLQLEAIVTMMSLSWGTLAGCFIGPYVYGLYSRRVNKVGAYASMIGCLITTVTLIFVFGAVYGGETFGTVFALGIKKAPLIGVIVMIQSMIVTPLFSLIGKKPDEELLNLCFKKEIPVYDAPECR